jgi:hypothetical protein
VIGISNIKAFRRGGLAAVVLAAALMVPAQAAMAGENCSQTRSDPTQAQYCEVAGVQGEGGNKPANNQGNEPATTNNSEPTGTTVTPAAVGDEAVQATTAEESGGSLPFTGLDVGILVLVAAGLTGTGLLLRRLTGSGAIRS